MAIRLSEKRKSYIVGILSIILASFLYALHRQSLQYVNNFSASINVGFTGAQYVFLQSFVQLVIISVVLLFYRTNPFVTESWLDLLLLLIIGVSKTLGLVLLYEAFRSIDVGIFSIFSSFSLFSTLIFTRMLINTDDVSCTFDVLSIVSALGVASIVEPDIVRYYYQNILPQTGKPILKYVGIMLAGVLCEGLSLVLSRAVALRMNYKLAVFYPSFIGSIALPVYMVATKTSFILGELPELEWYLILFSAMCGAVALYLTMFGLINITAVSTVLLLTPQVIWVYVYQMIIGIENASPIPFLGVILLVVTCILTLLMQIYDWQF